MSQVTTELFCSIFCQPKGFEAGKPDHKGRNTLGWELRGVTREVAQLFLRYQLLAKKSGSP